MSLASQFSTLASLGAQARLEIFGLNAAGTAQKGLMDDQSDTTKTFACYFSPVRSQEQLDAALFKDVHDTILRVAKTETNFEPTIGKIVRLIAANSDGTDIRVRISEIGPSGVNPEHVAGCKAVF
jgi:hypothetical protein